LLFLTKFGLGCVYHKLNSNQILMPNWIISKM
jgi:hypothetical protein